MTISLQEAQELHEIIGWLYSMADDGGDGKPADVMIVSPGMREELRRALEIAALVVNDLDRSDESL
jgi:hypothetical protein